MTQQGVMLLPVNHALWAYSNTDPYGIGFLFFFPELPGRANVVSPFPGFLMEDELLQQRAPEGRPSIAMGGSPWRKNKIW